MQPFMAAFLREGLHIKQTSLHPARMIKIEYSGVKCFVDELYIKNNFSGVHNQVIVIFQLERRTYPKG